MKQSLVVLLADIFNLFEIHPVQCVDYPEAENASGESTSFQPPRTCTLCFICLKYSFLRKSLEYVCCVAVQRKKRKDVVGLTMAGRVSNHDELL